MKVGAGDFLEKPFHLERLAATIDGILVRRERPPVYDDPVVAYVQRYATEVNSRGQVATRLGISQEQVSKRVQSVTGQSFRRFLHTCRLETAKRLLRTSDLPVAQVASRTGFQTVQHFSRVFRTYAGVSPRAFRLRSRVAPPEPPAP
jgi:AraC-like DNA-binding protein